MKYKMTLDNFECQMTEPSNIQFWIENEIGEYDNKSKRARDWCANASVGDVYDDDFIHIEVTD